MISTTHAEGGTHVHEPTEMLSTVSCSSRVTASNATLQPREGFVSPTKCVGCSAQSATCTTLGKDEAVARAALAEASRVGAEGAVHHRGTHRLSQLFCGSRVHLEVGLRGQDDVGARGLQLRKRRHDPAATRRAEVVARPALAEGSCAIQS